MNCSRAALFALSLLSSALQAGSAATSRPALAERVRQAFAACELAEPERVRVRAEDGVVTLGGVVRTLEERECLAIQAERVEGVSFLYPGGVAVRPRQQVGDAELVERARSILRDEAGLEGPAPLTVEVSNGRLRLAGEVRAPEDKYRAEVALRGLEGVTALENAVRVDPDRGLRSMEVRLQELLQVRQIPVENLRFYESEGRVVIEGRSHDVVARDVVEEFRRDLPGGDLLVDRLRLVLRRAPAEPDAKR